MNITKRMYQGLGLANAMMAGIVFRIGYSLSWDWNLAVITTALSATAVYLLAGPNSHGSIDRWPAVALRLTLVAYFAFIILQLVRSSGGEDIADRFIVPFLIVNCVFLLLFGQARRAGMRPVARHAVIHDGLGHGTTIATT